MSSIDPEVPPTGEEIHLPGGSVQPLLLTVGITILLIGVTTSIIIVVVGALLSLARTPSRRSALRLYLFSLAYLAALFLAMVADVKL